MQEKSNIHLILKDDKQRKRWFIGLKEKALINKNNYYLKN